VDELVCVLACLCRRRALRAAHARRADDHYFDTFTSRTCNDHALPCNTTTGACVAAADADLVHALGDFEYKYVAACRRRVRADTLALLASVRSPSCSYIWNAAQNASTYNSLTFGVFFAELAQNFAAFRDGTEAFKARMYVGHDGSMVCFSPSLPLVLGVALAAAHLLTNVPRYASRPASASATSRRCAGPRSGARL
jgi:hypothetical protein